MLCLVFQFTMYSEVSLANHIVQQRVNELPAPPLLPQEHPANQTVAKLLQVSWFAANKDDAVLP